MDADLPNIGSPLGPISPRSDTVDFETEKLEMAPKKRRISEFTSPVFLLSQVPKADKAELIDKIKRMNGTVLETDTFDQKATICIYQGNPIRNEKILCSMCSGISVLPAEYVHDSYNNEKQWLNPVEYRISYPTKKLATIKDSKKRAKAEKESNDLISGLLYWREKFTKCGADKDKIKPFYNWKVVLFASSSKGDALGRLIEAGGGLLIKITQNNEQIESYLSDKGCKFVYIRGWSPLLAFLKLDKKILTGNLFTSPIRPKDMKSF